MNAARAARGVARVGLGLLLGLALVSGLAATWIDADGIARAAGDQLSRRLGCAVAFEAVDVRWLPLSVRLRAVRLQPAEAGRPFLAAEQVDLRLSLLALLRGRVGWEDTRFDLRDGVAEIGTHRLEDVRIRGRMRPDRSIALAFSADLPGGASLRDGRLTLTTAADGAVAWSADALVSLDLGGATALDALDLASAEGVGEGTLALTGADRSLASGELVLAFRGLDLRDAEGRGIRGAAGLRAQLGGSWALDLRAAELVLGESLRKPSGVDARATGPVPEALPHGVGEWELRVEELRIGRSRFGGDVRMHAGRPSGELSGEVDLADLAGGSGWGAVGDVAREGRLHVEHLAYAPPLPLHGVGRVEHAKVELGERPWPLSLSGPVSILGSKLTTTRAAAELAGESFTVAGSYDLATERLEVEVAATSGVEVASLAGALDTGPFRTGRAYGRATLRAGPQLGSVIGHGELEVVGGTVSELSLARVGPSGIASGAGPHAFERLIGLFEIHGQRIEFTELILEQDGETARVTGALSLADGAVDLAGDVAYVIDDEEVATPIALSGTVQRLRASVEDPPEQQAERREAELTMLEAMRVQILDQPEPDDPERARAVREHVQGIEERLRRIEEEGSDA